MTVKNLVFYPDPRLKQKSAPVTTFDEPLATLAADMFDSMQAHGGIGLAGVQIGEMKRICVIHIPPTRNSDNADTPETSDANETDNAEDIKLTLINPDITRTSEELWSYQEGCLSIPEVYEDVERPHEIDVTYQDVEGHTHTLTASGLLATAIQHEIDHMDGILFFDRVSKLKRDRLIKKYTKLQKQNAISES